MKPTFHYTQATFFLQRIPPFLNAPILAKIFLNKKLF